MKLQKISVAFLAIGTLVIMFDCAGWKFSFSTLGSDIANIAPYLLFIKLVLSKESVPTYIAGILITLISLFVLIESMYISTSSTSALIFIFWPVYICLVFLGLTLLLWPIVKLAEVFIAKND